VALAPQGVDPRTMDVDEIVFDPALLDRFPSLNGEGMNRRPVPVLALQKPRQEQGAEQPAAPQDQHLHHHGPAQPPDRRDGHRSIRTSKE
jgi:hypothetical protein